MDDRMDPFLAVSYCAVHGADDAAHAARYIDVNVDTVWNERTAISTDQ